MSNEPNPPSGRRASAPTEKSAGSLFRPAGLRLQRRSDRRGGKDQSLGGPTRDRPGTRQTAARRARGLRPPPGRPADQGFALRRPFARAGKFERDRAVRAGCEGELNRYHELDIGRLRLAAPAALPQVVPGSEPRLQLTHAAGAAEAASFEGEKSCAKEQLRS